MASELRVNTLKDASGNNSVATSFIFAGTAKAWCTHNAAVSVTDSFNVSNTLDTGTGHFGIAFTSNMVNDDYCGSGSNIGSDNDFATGMVSDGAVVLTSRMDYQFRNYDTVNATDQDFQRVITHGDLA
jgi:hypothetical protein